MNQAVVAGMAGAVVGSYIVSGVNYLRADEMGEILYLEEHSRTVGRGPTWAAFPWRLIRFPTVQILLPLEIRIVASEARRADFFTESGERIRFDDLDQGEKEALLEDPLAKRSEIVVESPILYQFVRDDLHYFVTEVGTGERLGEILGLAVLNALEGVLSRLTVSTILERKDVLSGIFAQRLGATHIWGVRTIRSFIGPVRLSQKVEESLSERIRLAQEGHGRAEAITPLSELMQSEAGKTAVQYDITRQVYSGASKAILSTGSASPLPLVSV